MRLPSCFALPAALLFAVTSSFTAAAQNLLTNPSFDSDGAGWTEGGWVDAVFRDDVGSPFAGGSGPGALEIFFFYRGGGSNGVYQEVPVTGGETYSAALSVYMPSPDNPALQAPLGVGWYTATHGYIPRATSTRTAWCETSG